MNQYLEALSQHQQQLEKADKHTQPQWMMPLTLAYIGDALFETYVRHHLICQSATNLHRLHCRTVSYVNASAQAQMVKALAPLLTQREADIVRRGRNGKTGSIPRNADMGEYRYATGFEALLGWLFYQGETERLLMLMGKAVDLLDESLEEEAKIHGAL